MAADKSHRFNDAAHRQDILWIRRGRVGLFVYMGTVTIDTLSWNGEEGRVPNNHHGNYIQVRKPLLLVRQLPDGRLVSSSTASYRLLCWPSVAAPSLLDTILI